MPKFNVLITRDCTMSCQVAVLATSVEDAEAMAVAMVEADPQLAYWEADDGWASGPYIADPGNCAEQEG